MNKTILTDVFNININTDEQILNVLLELIAIQFLFFITFDLMSLTVIVLVSQPSFFITSKLITWLSWKYSLQTAQFLTASERQKTHFALYGVNKHTYC